MEPRREADPRVLTTIHVRTLAVLARGHQDYGPIGLRLEGGTALAAYYLGHRESEDLDLFGGQDFSAGDFAGFAAARLVAEGAVATVAGQANRGLAEILVQWQDADMPIKVQIARMSAFHLEPPIETSEGVPVASFRDVVAGKLHALCDRTVVRDVIDFHAILWRETGQERPTRETVAARLLAHAEDLQSSDPGLALPQLAQAVVRGQRAANLSEFPLRLLTAITDAEVRETCIFALNVLESTIAERLGSRPVPPK